MHLGRIKEKIWASLVVQMIKNLLVMQETQVWFLGGEDPMEKGMATHSSIFAWRIPGTEKPSELQPMGLQRVRHDWATSTHTHKEKTCSKCLGNDGQKHHYSSNLRCYLLLFSHSVFVTPWTATCQASLSFTISWSLLKFMSIESMIPCKHLILCHPFLLLPAIFPSIKAFSNESALHIRAKVLELQLQHQSFQWIFRVDFL